MSENNSLAKVEERTDIVPELEAGWKRRLVVDDKTGKVLLNHEDAVEAWRDFSLEETRKALLTGKLAGNRNAGVAKMALFQKFIESDSRDEETFKELAFEMNFNPETAETYYLQFQLLFGKKFRTFLIETKYPKKNEKKNDILEF